MANLEGFDATEQDSMRSFEALPKGDYIAMATESEMKPTKAGNGNYLQITFKVVDGPHKDRQIWARLNLDNPNKTAVEIAQRELGDICKAVGVLRPKDSSELHGIPLRLKVGVEKRKDTGEFSNKITGYEPANAASSNAPAQAQASAASKPPWAS